MYFCVNFFFSFAAPPSDKRVMFHNGSQSFNKISLLFIGLIVNIHKDMLYGWRQNIKNRYFFTVICDRVRVATNVENKGYTTIVV